MKKHRVTRRAFIKMGLVGVGGATLASCVPPTRVPTATPTARPTQASAGKILYPSKNTKVTNPDVVLKWDPTANAAGYALEVFVLQLVKDGTYAWDLAFSEFVRNTSYDVGKKGQALNPGGYYYWQVTPLANEMDLPSKDQYKLPSGITVTVDEGDHLHQQESIPYPDRNPLSGSMGSDSGRFYLKPKKNYLEKYLSFKLKPTTPIIPLTYCLLDRYYKLHYQPGAVKSTPLDEMFANSIQGLAAVPDDLTDRLGGDVSLLTQKRLQNTLTHYTEADRDHRVSLFGTKFCDLPADDTSEEWINDAVQVMFAGTPLELIHTAEKTIDIDFKNKLSGQIRFKEPVRLAVIDELLVTNGQFTSQDTYTLIILTTGNEEVDQVENMHLQKEADGTHSMVSESYFDGLDSASFKAKFIGNSLPGGLDGTAEVKGGHPVLLSVDPVSATVGSSNIKVKVRDGGNDPTITFTPSDGSIEKTLAMTLDDQTREYQTYKFSLTGAITRGTYSLRYKNSAGIASVNTLAFCIEGIPYTVRVAELRCIDESNPEWWGDDSISFSALINTSHFVQKPISSRVYDDFSDDTWLTWSEFDHGDGNIYYRDNPDADPAEICGRIIEDYLTVSIGIYEHDDLAWLAWLINEVIDIVQSFIEGLINAYTGGTGGYVLEFALEASGLNDMREQAINSLVSGWEVELLHEDTWNYPSSNYSLDMNGPESEYKLTFEVTRAQLCPAG